MATTLTWPEANSAPQESKIDADTDSESESVNVGFSKGLSCATVGDIERERDREREREVTDILAMYNITSTSTSGTTVAHA